MPPFSPVVWPHSCLLFYHFALLFACPSCPDLFAICPLSADWPHVDCLEKRRGPKQSGTHSKGKEHKTCQVRSNDVTRREKSMEGIQMSLWERIGFDWILEDEILRVLTDLMDYCSIVQCFAFMNVLERGIPGNRWNSFDDSTFDSWHLLAFICIQLPHTCHQKTRPHVTFFLLALSTPRPPPFRAERRHGTRRRYKSKADGNKYHHHPISHTKMFGKVLTTSLLIALAVAAPSTG